MAKTCLYRPDIHTHNYRKNKQKKKTQRHTHKKKTTYGAKKIPKKFLQNQFATSIGINIKVYIYLKGNSVFTLHPFKSVARYLIRPLHITGH